MLVSQNSEIFLVNPPLRVALFRFFEIIFTCFKIQQKFGTLYREGQRLENVQPLVEGIDSFYRWLKTNFRNGVILVAHGAYASDAPLIIKKGFQKAGWSNYQIENNVVGFCDTLHAFNKNFEGILICEELIQ